MPQLDSSVARPLSLRLRPDVVAVPVPMSGFTTWVVQDPLTLEHFQFTAEEHALLEALRQPASIEDLQRVYARQFPPQTITPMVAWDFVRRLHAAGLLVVDGPGQGSELLARERKDRTRRWGLAWMQLLAIRFRGFDPDAFLTAVHQRANWLFSPATAFVYAAVVLYALYLVVGHFGEFMDRLPGLSALTDVRNLPWLLIAVGGVKVCHELGHAFACKHFGGQVRELGLMLLVFSPCLYCDVSDSWRFASKWQRIAVSAAGMIVELFLASFAAIVWWHAQPGLVQMIALNVIIVASVGTLLVNGNPLMRYDGYYIVSDLAEVPNLWQRSREALRQFTARWLLADESPEDPLVLPSKRGWLALYALASKLYLTSVCLAIVWGLTVLLYPLHLQDLAYLLGMTMIAGALYPAVTSGARTLRNPSKRADFPKGRLAILASLAAAALVAALAWPVNYYVRAPFVLLPADAERIYATMDGTLTNVVAPGEKVARGETIAHLSNADVEMELRRMEGERDLQQLRVEHLDRLRGFDPEANERLPSARAALANLETRLTNLQSDAKRLDLVATHDGIVLPAPRIAESIDNEEQLPTWSGDLLDSANRGARVEPGTLICLVGEPSQLMAVLAVEDTDATHLQAGQKVRLRLEQMPGDVITGQVVEVARREMRDIDRPSRRSDLDSVFAGLITPGERRAYYHVQVQLDLPDQPLVWGGRGIAKVSVERITMGQRLLRFVARTFRLPLGQF